MLYHSNGYDFSYTYIFIDVFTNAFLYEFLKQKHGINTISVYFLFYVTAWMSLVLPTLQLHL